MKNCSLSIFVFFCFTVACTDNCKDSDECTVFADLKFRFIKQPNNLKLEDISSTTYKSEKGTWNNLLTGNNESGFQTSLSDADSLILIVNDTLRSRITYKINSRQEKCCRVFLFENLKINGEIVCEECDQNEIFEIEL